MSTDLFERLCALPSRTVASEPGATLFRRDDPVRAVFLVEAGSVRLVRWSAGGTALTLQRAGPGRVLAEASLFAERYHCDAVVDDPARLRAIDAKALRAALRADPDLSSAWTAFLAREIQGARLRAEILSLRTVAERLDAWLAANDDALPAKGAWRLVATEIGTSPEALYRELARRRR